MATDLQDIYRLLPDYDLGRELGRGQFGAVFAARHRQLARDVAIKRLVVERSSADAARFQREARVLAQLDHPHVVRVYDYREQGTIRLLIMELLTGGSFADRVRDGVDVETAVAGTMAAAAGLHHVHQAGVLHRDVKPENLMLSGSGTLKVTDFGLARGDVAGQTAVELTQSGTFFGTPAYVAPEQVAEALAPGWPPVGPAADEYSLAAVLYGALSGALPHDTSGGFMALCERRLNDEAIPLLDVAPDVPPEVAEVIMRALSRDPAQRYETAEAFGVALGTATTAALGPGWIGRSDIEIREAGPLRDAAGTSGTDGGAGGSGRAGDQPAASSEPRSRWRWAVVAVPAAVLVAVVLLILAFSRPATQTATGGMGGGPGGSTATPLTLTPTWRFQTGGNVFASPLVASGLVVQGSFDHKLYGIDTATGAEHWTFPTDDSIRSSAASHDGTAFVGSDDGNVYAVGISDGKQRWKAPLRFQIVSSPAVDGGMVVVGADALYGLHEIDGSQAWRFQTDDDVVSSPAISGGIAFVGANDGKVYAVDLATGTKKWDADTHGPVQSSPTVLDGVVYVGTNDKAVLALDAETGKPRWREDVGAEVKSTPAVSSTLVVVGTGGNELVALDRETGKERWSFATRDKVDSSPLLLGDRVVVGSNDGNVYVVDASSGALEGAFQTDSQIVSSPRLAGSRVVVASYGGTIYVLDGVSG